MTQMMIICMLERICGRPKKTLRRIGMSSEKDPAGRR